MAALSITAAQVLLVSGDSEKGNASAVITQGQAVYKSGTDGTWGLAQNDGTADEAGATNAGIALNAVGAAGQPISVALDGAVVNLGAGAAAVAGQPYFIGATAGQLVVLGDLSSTNKVTPLAFGIGSNQVLVRRVYNVGSVKP